MEKSKRPIFVLSVVLSILILFGFSYLTNAKKNDPYFNYDNGANSSGFVQVISGSRVNVPFEFLVGETSKDVRLEIKDSHFVENGASLRNSVVPVKNGIASSAAIMQFPAKQVKPGTYFLKIEAKDSSGKILRTGEIPFTVDMHEIVSTCSC